MSTEELLVRRWGLRAVLLVDLALSQGCIPRLEPCSGKAVHGGDALVCPMPAYTDRAFDLELPASWDGVARLPLIVAIHGGGGKRDSADRGTCPTGSHGEPGCFSEVAKARGFAVVRPDGTGAALFRNIRTWNAGGGRGEWNCASGPACKAGVDDVRYFSDLLDEVGRIVPVDPKRVYATGLSNGGAMSHRLACELPGRFAAIAAVGGGNQLAAAGGPCPKAVPVLQIHGTLDPCWGFHQSDASCIEGSNAGTKVGVAESMEGWRLRNGCTKSPTEAQLPDLDPGDGTRVVDVRWSGCTADLELLRVEGGGHTWPNGYQYFSVDRIGRVTRDMGSDRIVDFFLAHPGH